jgi:hypothetical protein
MKSPRTTGAAIVMLIGGLFAFVLVPVFDGDPSTAVNWVGMGGAATAFYAWINSRDQAQHDKDKTTGE